MRFTKMHGIGNDYVYVNCLRETVADPARTARFVSDRHFGIGSDGLILIKPSDAADFEMEMYNADGSRGAMCGNGIRCVAKYVYDYGLTDRTHISIATGSGIKYLDLQVEDGKVSLVTVDMGAPELVPERIPVDVSLAGAAAPGAGEVQGASEPASEKSPAGADLAGGLLTNDGKIRDEVYAVSSASGSRAPGAVVGLPVTVGGCAYEMTCVSMGNPHCIVRVPDVDGLAIEQTGPQFENHPMFPDRVNTEFIRVIDRRTVQMRVWERGSGETLACGTGACAVTVACVLNGWTEDSVTVRLRGGDLQIHWDREKNTVFMTGPATVVFEGEITL